MKTGIDLELELEKFRECAEENPKLVESKEIGDFIGNFLFKTAKYDINPVVLDLAIGILLENPRYFENKADGSIKIYKPGQFYTRLESMNWFNKYLINTPLTKIGFERGFNREAKNFVISIYKIIYDTYLKGYAEKERKRKRKNDPFHQFVKAGWNVKGIE